MNNWKKALLGFITLLLGGGSYLGVTTYTNSKLTGRINVGSSGSYATIKEAVDWFNANATKSYEILVDTGSINITTTTIVSSTHALYIRGLGIEATILNASTGLGDGQPFFQCNTDCFINRLSANASTLAGYGDADGENFVTFSNKVGLRSEVTDVDLTGFYNTIEDKASADLFVFNSVIRNSQNGIMLNHDDGGESFADIETNTFENCTTSINLKKATTGGFAIVNNIFDMASSGVGINYVSSTFSYASTTNIIGNNFSTLGTPYQGFDFTRQDGRDADVEIISNINIEDKTPHFSMSVTNNANTKTVTTAGTYYIPTWTNTFDYGCKSYQLGNKATYLSSHRKDAVFFISGNVAVNNNNRNVTLKLRFDGTTLTTQEMTVRCATANQPYPFTLIVYAEDIVKNSYVELALTSSSNGDVVTVQDINWYGYAR